MEKRVEVLPKKEVLKHLVTKKATARKPNEQELERLANLKAEIKKSLEGKPRFYEGKEEKLLKLIELAESKLANKQITGSEKDHQLLEILKTLRQNS